METGVQPSFFLIFSPHHSRLCLPFADPPSGIFGVPLHRSINYANVAISLTNPTNGKQFVYGYVPIVVAKCGVFLKDRGRFSLPH